MRCVDCGQNDPIEIFEYGIENPVALMCARCGGGRFDDSEARHAKVSPTVARTRRARMVEQQLPATPLERHLTEERVFGDLVALEQELRE